MKSHKKTKSLIRMLKKIVILIVIVAIIIVGKVSIEGYDMYKQAIAKVSLADKVDTIRSEKGYTKIENISKDYIDAVIAIEDHRFKEHDGIDYIATFRAAMRDIKYGHLAEGGSTITQQLAKNMYFTKEKKFERKVAELFVAFKLEKEYSKEDIIEMYMNIVYFGNGYYGIGDACNGYFDKDPIDITLYEATILAGLPNAPSVYALDENSELAKERQIQVLDCMVKYNYLSEEESQAVINQNK